MDSETKFRRIGQRLDQIEHLLRQHQVRQNRLEKLAEELRVVRQEVAEATEALSKLRTTKTLIKRIERLEAK